MCHYRASARHKASGFAVETFREINVAVCENVLDEEAKGLRRHLKKSVAAEKTQEHSDRRGLLWETGREGRDARLYTPGRTGWRVGSFEKRLQAPKRSLKMCSEPEQQVHRKPTSSGDSGGEGSRVSAVRSLAGTGSPARSGW